MLKKFNNFFSNNIGIDLGTANTLVYVSGEGIIINEPSVVAVNQKTGQVVAIGTEAKKMVGRTPAHISAVRPLVDGVISDFEVAEEMIAYFIKRAQKNRKNILSRPRVVIGVPSGVTNVEARAVRDAARNAGAREVHIVEEPMAAAIGMRLPVGEPVGNMVIDIGGGTSDVAIISLGGIVLSKSLKMAGDRLNQDIIHYARDEFKILLGEQTAEDVKIAIGSVIEGGDDVESAVRGRDLITGLPREVILTASDVRQAIAKTTRSLVDSVKEVLEETPPELVSDIMHRGIMLVGGGSYLKGLAEHLSSEVKIPVYVADEPLTAVVRGTGIILDNLDELQDVLIRNEDDLPPQ